LIAERQDVGVGGVLAGSGKTGNDSRDKKMNKDILKVEQYTTVSFEPKTYTGTIAPSGDSNLQVTGTFTLLGTPHEISIPSLFILRARQRRPRRIFKYRTSNGFEESKLSNLESGQRRRDRPFPIGQLSK